MKRSIIWLLAAGLTAAVLWAVWGGEQGGGYSATTTAIPESDFTAIAQGKVDVDGGIIEVAARSGGVFREVFVSEGERVEPQQRLAVMEDDEQRIALRSAEAGLKASEAALERLHVRRTIAEREFARLEPLVEIDAASTLELDRAADELRQLDVDLLAQEAALLQAEIGLESARFRLEQRTVRAPMAGRIIDATARPGVGASTLEVSTAFTLMPDTQKIVRTNLDQGFVNAVMLGQAVSISPEANPMESHPGKVLRIGEIFGRSEDSSGGGGDNTLEVVIGAGDIPLLIGQRVMVRFLKEPAGAAPTAKSGD